MFFFSLCPHFHSSTSREPTPAPQHIPHLSTANHTLPRRGPAFSLANGCSSPSKPGPLQPTSVTRPVQPASSACQQAATPASSSSSSFFFFSFHRPCLSVCRARETPLSYLEARKDGRKQATATVGLPSVSMPAAFALHLANRSLASQFKVLFSCGVVRAPSLAHPLGACSTHSDPALCRTDAHEY